MKKCKLVFLSEWTLGCRKIVSVLVVSFILYSKFLKSTGKRDSQSHILTGKRDNQSHILPNKMSITHPVFMTLFYSA